MTPTRCVQDIFLCDQCKSASDIHGMGCKHGLMYPLNLLIAGCKECPNYELDTEKIKEKLESEKKR